MSTATHPSTPAEASGPAASDQVDSYVQAVRAALSDLPSEEVEDLTAGMDADLAELLAERGGPLEVVRDPLRCMPPSCVPLRGFRRRREVGAARSAFGPGPGPGHSGCARRPSKGPG